MNGGLRTSRVFAVVASLSVMGVLAACSEHVEAKDPCASNPNAKGCKKTSDAPASAASTYVQPTPNTPTPPTPPTADAGRDGAADAAAPTKPNVPPVSTACRDLARCCGQVKDTLERAACVALTVNQDSGKCANAMIAYQVFGGCGHSPLSLPDIFNSDKTPNQSKDCSYLERACADDPSQCDAAYQCDGVDVPGTETTPTDYCDTQPDPYCCRYPNDFDCGGSPPPSSSDPCDSAPDPYCCKYPNNFDCGGSDGCDSAPDPYCCRNPSDIDCNNPGYFDP